MWRHGRLVCAAGALLGTMAVAEIDHLVDLDHFFASQAIKTRPDPTVARHSPPFVRAIDHAIPPALLPRLIKDAEVARSLSATDSGLKHGKKVTYFHKVAVRDGLVGGAHPTAASGKRPGPHPRFATEEAILHLAKLGFATGEFEKLGIVGAEWWYHSLPEPGSIQFHYDKDEAVASDQMRMVFPLVSTVSYLTSVGGPTVILNMTSVDGTHHVPPIAAVGHFSYPVGGRHTMFDGRMLHGVLPAPTDGPDSGHTRITLLVNWWTNTPHAPNCRALTPAEASRFVAASGPPPPPPPPATISADANRDQHVPPTGSEDQVRPTRLGATGAKDGGGSQVMIKIAAETHFLWVPRNPPSNKLGRVRWNGTQSLGGVVEVDMTVSGIVTGLTQSLEPKLVYFSKRGRLAESKAAFFPAVKRLKHHSVLAHVAEWGPQSERLWALVGLAEADAPSVVIIDTQTDRHYLLAGAFTTHSIVQFVAEYYEKKLRALPNSTPRHRQRRQTEL